MRSLDQVRGAITAQTAAPASPAVGDLWLDTDDATVVIIDGTISPPAALSTHITPVRFLGILDHTGAPVAADGTFAAGDSVFDTAGQEYLCTAGGTPGTWVAVGSGRSLGATIFASLWTMTTAATAEDVPGFTVSFTYDGRPVVIRAVIPAVYQDQAAVKTITGKILRSTDSAVVATGYAVPNATASSFQQMLLETGPITAWPSDSAAFVVGTTYTVKFNLTSGAASKASIFGTTGSRAVLEVVTR